MPPFKSLPLSQNDLRDGYLPADLLDEYARVQQYREKLQARLKATDQLSEGLALAAQRDLETSKKRGYEAGWQKGVRDGKAETTKALLELYAHIGADIDSVQSALVDIATDVIRQTFYGLDLSDQVAIAVSTQMATLSGNVTPQIYVHPDRVEAVESLLENANQTLGNTVVVHADAELDETGVEIEIGEKILDISPVAQLEQALKAVFGDKVSKP